VGFHHRPIVLRGNGTFAAGGAGCERYWTIRDGRLMIAGDDGRLTMDLTPTADGGWDGAWLVFEKMGVRLEATRHAVLTSSIPNVKLQYDSTATSHAKRRRETL